MPKKDLSFAMQLNIINNIHEDTSLLKTNTATELSDSGTAASDGKI
jgi:hypothetical protein